MGRLDKTLSEIVSQTERIVRDVERARMVERAALSQIDVPPTSLDEAPKARPDAGRGYGAAGSRAFEGRTPRATLPDGSSFGLGPSETVPPATVEGPAHNQGRAEQLARLIIARLGIDVLLRRLGRQR